MTFVVLSGYGDYEYTSQAMELGVRHYGRRNWFIMQTTKKQKVPAGERPVVHITIVCGFSGCVLFRGAPCFCFIMVGCTSKRIYRFFFSFEA